MEKEVESFDAWVQCQRDFWESMMDIQKNFWQNVAESSRKMQEAMMRPGFFIPGEWGEGFPQKEAAKSYSTMVETMIQSSKSMTDEAVRMQEAWRQAMDKQMDIGRRMTVNFFEMGKQKTREKAKEAA